jgi:hypothetical protein
VASGPAASRRAGAAAIGAEIESTLSNANDRRIDAFMARRTLNRLELRAAHEAAEERGLISEPEPRSASRARAEPSRRTKPAAAPKMRVVWAVCDVGGRTVATFDYPSKADAEALVARLKTQGKGMHFLRALKEPIQPDAG